MDKPLMVAVCDGNKTERELSCAMAEDIMLAGDFRYNISEFASGRELMEAIDGGRAFDIVLLDVFLEDMNGVDLAAALRERESRVEIVLVSKNMDMALRGYEVSAARYLVKPLEKEKLKEALCHCHRSLRGRKEIVLPTDEGQRRVAVEDICMAEASERGAKIFCENETIQCKLKFMDVEERLNRHGFIMCHRSYIVNVSRIRNIRRYEFELTDGRKVPIGRARYGEMRNRFFAYVDG